MSLNIAAGLGLGDNESYPDLFQPFGGFPAGVEVKDGHITMPELPGNGFEGKANLYQEMQALSAWERRIAARRRGARRAAFRADRRQPGGNRGARGSAR